MADIRYYEEQPCEHGFLYEHVKWEYVNVPRSNLANEGRCPGGSRRKITLDYRAAAVEWLGDEPPDNYPGEWEQMIESVIEQTVQPIVDAALARGDTREDSE